MATLRERRRVLSHLGGQVEMHIFALSSMLLCLGSLFRPRPMAWSSNRIANNSTVNNRHNKVKYKIFERM
jgi:hypothetical protein